MNVSAASGKRETPESDAALLAAVAEGSEEALAELDRRYRAIVERTCRAVVGRDSDDCTQEVFARVWRKARLFDPARGSATGWLLTLARHVAYSLSRRPPPVPVAPGSEPAVPVEDDPVADRLWILDALARLPSHERAVLELAYFHDRSQSQIATDLSLPLGTVKSWTRRGLNRLALLLEEADR